MKTVKKVFSLILALVLITSAIPVTVNAWSTSGKSGDVFWSYDEERKEMTISGYGDIGEIGPMLWFYGEEITTVYINDGVTSIGERAFKYFTALKSISIPVSVTQIGLLAFEVPVKVYYDGTVEQFKKIQIDGYKPVFSYSHIYCSDGEVLPSGTYGDNLTWDFDVENGLLTISGTGDMPNTSTPWNGIYNLITDVYIDDGVTSIEYEAFKSHESLKKIRIPDSVMKIGEKAFFRCTNLESIAIPDSVTEIGWAAFYECTSLTDITIPSGVNKIVLSTFYGCSNLAGITIPLNVTEIQGQALPYSVTIYYQGTKEQWKSFEEQNSSYPFCHYVCCSDGQLFPTGKCGDNLTWTFDKNTGTLTISGTGEMYNYSSHIDEYDYFYIDSPWYNIKDLIKFVEMEDTVTSIGDYAFYECGNLEDVKVSNNLMSIGADAFAGCSSLEGFEIPENVTSIGDCAFYECSKLESIVIPDSVTELGDWVFRSCKNLKSVVIGDGATKIGDSCFESCENLKSVALGKSVKIIDEDAFYRCENLTEITMSSGLEWISSGAFVGQHNAIKIYHSGTKEDLRKIWVSDTLNNSAFCASKFYFDNGEVAGLYGYGTIWYYDEKTSTVTISGSGEKYSFAFPYSLGFYGLKYNHIVVDDGTQRISDCSGENVQTVVVPESVQEIQQGAFYNCNNLSTVYYLGSREQWNEIQINTQNNEPLLNAQIVYNACFHKYTGTQVEATCTKHGYVKYTCDACGHYYNDYTTNPTGHSINADGVCENCGKQEAVNNTASNNQLLSFDSILQLIVNLISKMFDFLSVPVV